VYLACTPFTLEAEEEPNKVTSRQQRRLEQKLARKAQKKAFKGQNTAPHGEQASPPAYDFPVASISEAKLAAASAQSELGSLRAIRNRANAQLSTGPATEAGKAISSQNATKHGLTGKFKVLASESQSEFDRLLAGLMFSEAPVGDEEAEMVHQMAEAFWLSRRAIRLQNECFAALESGARDEPASLSEAKTQKEEQRAAHKLLALYLRYQTAHDRTFSRYATELRKRRGERARAERGFASQKLKEAAERRRQELHEARQNLQGVKQEAQEIRNRLTAAKAEALELKNLTNKSKLLAAAA